MLRWFYHRLVRRLEQRYGYDATYLHELADAAPPAFRRFMRMQLSGRWSGQAPRDAMYAAGIGAALHEDCGPCVQIATDIALEAGVPAATIGALLSGGRAPDDAQLGFNFARALLAADPGLDDLRTDVKARWGDKGIIALSLAAMTGRNYPVMKRAMGHAKTCQRVRIGSDTVAVAPTPMAA